MHRSLDWANFGWMMFAQGMAARVLKEPPPIRQGWLDLHDLENFRLADMIESGKEIRRLGAGAECMEEAAGAVVDFLYSCFVGSGSSKHCHALVRCFKTHAYGRLPAELQELARAQLDETGMEPADDMRCLALVASRGEEPAWNGRHGSERHRVIPLPTAKIVAEAPMVARMIRQMGLEIEHVVGRPEDLLLDLEQRSFNVFHVEEAEGSEYVPAQEVFVKRHGVRSALGMGGLLPSGDLFVVVMFSKVKISRETAAMFRTLALSVKVALLPFAGGKVFAGQ